MPSLTQAGTADEDRSLLGTFSSEVANIASVPNDTYSSTGK
jgi:hypothetical protein